MFGALMRISAYAVCFSAFARYTVQASAYCRASLPTFRIQVSSYTPLHPAPPWHLTVLASQASQSLNNASSLFSSSELLCCENECPPRRWTPTGYTLGTPCGSGTLVVRLPCSTRFHSEQLFHVFPGPLIIGCDD
ncbi:hypothetical protein FB446DRAFT_367953 [Lentinula raphanica]|nr:hypothetical protein FB446DRAFT_367953 [Lentinula raphanica]